MKIKILIFTLLFFASANSAYASDTTHLLGTTGYMIREAMLVGANKKDPANYQKAVALQREAKKAFHGTAKGGRNLDQCVALTRQAYDYAKLARDNAAPERYQNSKNLFYKSIGK